VLIAPLRPDIPFAIPINQRTGGFALFNKKRVASKMWNTVFTYRGGGLQFGVNLPGIHPFQVIATVPDAHACSDNSDFSGRASNDRYPNFPGRAFLYQNGCIYFSVTIEIPSEIGWVNAKGEIILLSRGTVR
jgi:hypothetical protein